MCVERDTREQCIVNDFANSKWKKTNPQTQTTPKYHKTNIRDTLYNNYILCKTYAKQFIKVHHYCLWHNDLAQVPKCAQLAAFLSYTPPEFLSDNEALG